MKHKLLIEVGIPLSQRMMIGSGFGDSTVNRKCLRTAAGEPYIPGSILKGIIRNECEKLAVLYNFQVISPHNINNIENFKSSSETGFIIDKLFGSRFEGDKLFFSDALSSDNTLNLSEIISRNSIDRLFGTSKDAHLFSTEYIRNVSGKNEDYRIYNAEINGWHDNLTEEEIPPEYCLLVLAILLCQRIGGDKSTGAGWIKDGIIIERIVYNGKVFLKEEIFDKFLGEFLSYDYEDILVLVEEHREINK